LEAPRVNLLISRPEARSASAFSVREVSMAALLWLLIPVAAGVVASAWGGWAARRRTVVPDSAGVAGYDRFRAAMARTHGGQQPPADPSESAASTPRVPVNHGTRPPAAGPTGREAN
jgi:hypothetical protein